MTTGAVMDTVSVSILGPVWLSLGAFIVACALGSQRSARALRWGCYGVSVLWVAAGAAVNAVVLLAGSTYTGFADNADVAFVRETWESLVVPNHTFFIGLLVVFEAMAGILVLVPGRARQVSLLALTGFTIALLSFSWVFVFWSAPIAVALGLLLRAERRRAATPSDPSLLTPGAGGGRPGRGARP